MPLYVRNLETEWILSPGVWYVRPDHLPGVTLMQKKWVGEQGNNWNKADNWEPPGVPTLMDDVILPPDAAIVVVGKLVCNTIQGAEVA